MADDTNQTGDVGQTHESAFKLYSIGIVAANKALDSKEIEVTPNEKFPMLDGEITDNATNVQAQAVNKTGEAYDTNVNVTNTIKATWLPMSQSNRITAPDVRRGERVRIYQFSDQTDKYYWTTLEEESHLRKLETVVYAYSGTQDEGQATDATSSYYVEFSTHKKSITVHTSKADGEPYAYDIQINAKDGRIVVQDDNGNYMLLDSKETIIHIENSTGSFMEINKNDINFNAVENFNGKVGKNFTFDVGGDISFTAGKSIEHIAGTTALTDASATITHNAPVINEVGDLNTLPGKGGSKGSGTLSGDFLLQGSMHADHDLTADGKVTANIVESIEDFIGPNV